MRGRQSLIPLASHDDDALLAACRSGDRDAARQLVGRRQRELLRLAYLLTGDEVRALELASATLLDVLRAPPEQLDQPEPGRRLALDLARRYLRAPSRSTWLNRDDADHYTVDDERSRTKAALDRLGPEQRATLALHHVAGVPTSALQNALGLDGRRAAEAALEQAQRRVALAVGRAEGASLVELFNRLLVDAPHADLWPDLETPLQRAWSARRRSERLLTAGVVAGMLLLLAGGVIWLGGFRLGSDDSAPTSTGAALRSPEEPPPADVQPTATDALAAFAAAPTITMPAASVITVEDLLLLRAYEQGNEGRSSLAFYDVATNSSTALTGGGGTPLISPDGRWAVSATELPGSSDDALLAGAALDGSATWEAPVTAPRSLALGTDRIYAVIYQIGAGYALQVFDLFSGELVDTWAIERDNLRPSTLRSIKLVLAPEGDRLTLLTTHIDREQERWIRELTVYQTETGDILETLGLTARQAGGSTSFGVRGARLIPGENAVYSLEQNESASQVHLEFLDLDDGTVSELLLPLEARSMLVAARRGETELHLIPSNTGAVLYVLQSRQRQIAIVDLRTRSLIGVFPLSAGEADRGAFASNLNHVAYIDALLSPDGGRLYLAVNRERNLPISSYPLQSPVWVIDTTTWEVVDRWMVGGMPRRLTMSGDGAQIYLRSARGDGSVILTTFATATGATRNTWEALASPDWAGVQRVDSVAQLYHEQYGLRPRTGATIPADNPALAVLPGVSVEAEGALAGVEAEVTARIVHPVTGELASSDRTLRFDAGATLAIEMSNGAERAIFVPAAVEPGVYRGRVRLNAAGDWTARVTVINRDGSTWEVSQPGAIAVAEGLVAEDGGAYRFLVRPANPVNRRTITLRVWMVESQSRERLPEEIEFLDQISEDARIILTHASGERVEETLTRITHSSFMGWVRFGAAGEWTAEIELLLGSTGRRVSIGAGTIEINDLTEPYQRNSSAPSGGGAVSD